jgi:hypothetical protein
MPKNVRRQIGRMRLPVHNHRLAHLRALLSVAAVALVAVGAATSGSIAQGRVESGTGQPATMAMSPDTIAIVTGGGTVKITGVPDIVASFGVNGKRPAGFVQNGQGVASGRINYNKHAQVAGRHVNVPVVFMNAELSSTPSPNGTGGKAQLIGNCGASGAECPSSVPAFQSVLVYVEDNSDSGGGSDVFQISYCTGAPSANVAAMGCGLAEGGTLRTGNIQIRGSVSGSSPSIPTAARAPLRLP